MASAGATEAARAHVAGPPLDASAAIMPADYPSHRSGADGARTALVFGERRTSFAALDHAASAFVGLLAEAGIGKGDRIGYFGRNTDAFPAVLFGALRAGAVLVPINWRYTAPETRFVLEDSGARLVVADADFADLVREADAGAGRPLVLTDGEGDGSLLAALAARAAAPRVPVDPDAPCLQLYTSGTTGKPKGVLLSQRTVGINRHIELVSDEVADWDESEVLLSAVPNFHVGGISWMCSAVMRGVTCVLTVDPAPSNMLDMIVRHGCTRTWIVPAMVRALLDEMRASGRKAASLRGIHYGAAPMDVALLRDCIAEIGCKFLQYYGMTEVSGSATMLGPDCHDPERPALLRSVGRVTRGFEIEIRDTQKRPVAVGMPGEIWLRSPTVMLGYANRPEATAEAIEDGWYRTGDGGRLDEDGLLFLTDRIKDMVVTGGENVYPVEVEAVLREHPAVFEVAVFGLPDAKWGEMVCAAVEVRPGTEADAAALIAHARRSLAGYKVPKRVELGVTLPRTASGKVQRGMVRKLFLEGQGG